jgi:dCMP deaminase
MNKDQYYIEIAIAVSKKSKCNRAKVGSVVVLNNRIVSTGYNGTPVNCPIEFPEEIIDNNNYTTSEFVIHSEANALMFSMSPDLNGATIYTTLYPCKRCSALIAQKGIKKVVYLNEYHQKHDSFFESMGIEIKQFKS